MADIKTFKDRDTWMRAIFREGRLTLAQRAILVRVALFLRVDTGELPFRWQCLQEALADCSPATIMRAMQRAEVIGWITITRNGRYRANGYALTFPPHFRSESNTTIAAKVSPTSPAKASTTIAAKASPTIAPKVKILNEEKTAERSEAKKDNARASADALARGFGDDPPQAQSVPPCPRPVFGEHDFVSSDGSVKFTHEEIEELRADLPSIRDIRAMVRQAFRWAVEEGMPAGERKKAMRCFLIKHDEKKQIALKDQAERSALRERQAAQADKRRADRARNGGSFHLLP